MNRPTPDQVVEIVSGLGSDGKSVSIPEIVARIRMRIGCSRATAYRGVAKAFAAGAIARVMAFRATCSTCGAVGDVWLSGSGHA
jgi:hypothetical protein